jgi:fatty acid-binding protein DegV
VEQLAVIHTRRQEMAEEVADRLAEHIGFLREHIWVRETGTVLSAHGGTGLIGVLALPAANGPRR